MSLNSQMSNIHPDVSQRLQVEFMSKIKSSQSCFSV